jgi:diguanylate cyclase (GGDEF)-like protein
MKAAAAARKWWARLRRQPLLQAQPRSGAGAGTLMPVPTRPPSVKIARGSSFSLVLLAGAMIACAAVGVAVTQRNDARHESERHAALQLALDELRAVFGDIDHFDHGQLRFIERRSGLNDLRFEADPATAGGREVQSLHDAQGRIVGWLNWAPDRALIRAMDWLWGLVGAVGLALVLCAVIAAQATRRLVRSLARSVETIRKLTSEDALTGLANQRVMLERLDHVLKSPLPTLPGELGRGHVAFALVDPDGFREVNDTLGRAGGDAVLLRIAERLKAGLPAGALLGRFEDDEFAIIVSGDDAPSAIMLADVLRASISPPTLVDRTWQITVGIGVAQAPDDGTTGEELARRAGLALRAAKRDGRGTARRFSPQIEMEHSERRFLRHEMESAILQQAFDIHYQPVVAAAGGAIIGVEALLRWTHPTRGAIAPSVFIPVAEQCGLMIRLGEIVLRRALADAARWPSLFVAINLSPVQLRDRGFVDLIGAALAETGIASARVVLEVTEGILIDDPQGTQARLEALHALGVSIALDDFGTGYSSLSYLQKFPFQRLKIDRAFVASLGAGGNTGAIIQSIVTLGHALGMSVLAEGVETDEQRVLLRLAGCDEMQGYLFAKPRPAETIDKFLARPAAAARAAAGQAHASAR